MLLRDWFVSLRKVQGRKQCRTRAYHSEVLAVRMRLVQRKHREAGKAAR
jgi:hypothetical protein